MSQDLSPKDREFLQKNFARYGEAWKPGFEMFERHFTVSVEKKWRKFVFTLTTRDAFRLTYVHTVGRRHGNMSTDRPRLPGGPELQPNELAQVDEILKATRELWLFEPLNNECQWVRLENGLAGLRGDRKLSTRRLGDQALLYLGGAEFDWGLFCVCVDLVKRTISEIQWWELPPSPGKWMRAEEVEFIDRNLRKHGDFGVYGNVTSGLRELAEYFDLKIRDEDGRYHLSVYPRDGYGHFLHFSMDKATGEIGGCAAGHLEPRPAPGDCDPAVVIPEPPADPDGD